MTIALCYCCGNEKRNSMVQCTNCGRVPQSEKDMFTSLAITDEYFGDDDLKNMALRIRSGRGINVNVDDDAKRKFREVLSKNGFLKQPTFVEKLLRRKAAVASEQEIGVFKIVDEWIRPFPLVLIGSERCTIDEQEFGIVLIAAKTEGWSGGDRFFRLLDKNDGALLPFFSGAGIWGDEAIELAMCFRSFVQSDGDASEDGMELANVLHRLGGSGGFKIEVGEA